MLRFRVLGASFSRFGCFVLWSSFSSALFSKLPSTAYHDPAPKDPVDTLLSHTKVSKKIYECPINEKASTPSRSQGKWLEERDIHCNLSIIVNWENTNCLSSLCTRESKRRAFQFKFLHRKIATAIVQDLFS